MIPSWKRQASDGSKQGKWQVVESTHFPKRTGNVHNRCFMWTRNVCFTTSSSCMMDLQSEDIVITTCLNRKEMIYIFIAKIPSHDREAKRYNFKVKVKPWKRDFCNSFAYPYLPMLSCLPISTNKVMKQWEKQGNDAMDFFFKKK